MNRSNDVDDDTDTGDDVDQVELKKFCCCNSGSKNAAMRKKDGTRKIELKKLN